MNLAVIVSLLRLLGAVMCDVGHVLAYASAASSRPCMDHPVWRLSVNVILPGCIAARILPWTEPLAPRSILDRRRSPGIY